MASKDEMGAEMTAQVTALSTKLLEAIDRQADLEDQIQVMRKELDHSRRENMRYEDRVKSGDLVNKSVFALEKAKRENAESQVVRLQGEIEELTSSLFDEANKMVASANRETNDRERRNDQLVQQLKERDVLLENLQEQLSGLKMVLQTMSDQQDDYVSRAMPDGGVEDDTDVDEMSGSIIENNGSRSIPLSMTSVYRPVVRHDLQNFHEFLLMVPPPQASPRASVIMSAADSSITNGRASPAHFAEGHNSASSSLSPSLNHTPTGSNVTLSTITTTTTTTTTTSTSNISTLTSRFQSLSSNSNSTPGLKDFKFFKRSVGDDIEPTLHLEAAPGLSWLSRRNIMSSILDGSIVVEPIAAANEGYKLMVAGPETEDAGLPEYIGLSKTISGGSTNTVQPTSSNGGMSGSYVSLNQQSMSAYIASSNGQKIRTHLAGGNGVGLPVATRAPCALCGEKRDNSLLYARLHNLRSSNKDKQGASSSVGGGSRDSSLGGSHGYHRSTDSTGSYASTMTTNDSNDKTSIDNNNNNNNDNISIYNEGMTSSNSSILSGGVPGAYPVNSAGSSNVSSVSTGYPLCFYCLNRVRSVCDYVSFVRSIRAGLWKIEDESGQMRAWEECVRLRERMFWARNGGYYIMSETGQPMDVKMLVSAYGGSTSSLLASRRHTMSKASGGIMKGRENNGEDLEATAPTEDDTTDGVTNSEGRVEKKEKEEQEYAKVDAESTEVGGTISVKTTEKNTTAEVHHFSSTEGTTTQETKIISPDNETTAAAVASGKISATPKSAADSEDEEEEEENYEEALSKARSPRLGGVDPNDGR